MKMLIKNNYIYLTSLTELGNYSVPLEYFVGGMKYDGLGCIRNRQAAHEITILFSPQGIDQATNFLENNFD